MKAIQPQQWVDDTPAWEHREVNRHLRSSDQTLTSEFIDQRIPLEEAIDRRRRGEPLEYILGHCHLPNITLEINPSVLVPRQETETLLRRFLDRLSDLPAGPIVDCGTGSGLLAVGIGRRTDRTIVGSDVSTEALQLARRNAHRNGVNLSPVLCDRLRCFNGQLAAVVANLPYVLPSSEKLSQSARDYEPRQALMVPGDPANFYRTFLKQASNCLKPNGELWMELDEELLDSVPLETIVSETADNLTFLDDENGQLRYAIISGFDCGSTVSEQLT
ncbi:MAG: class I SAM-dependent methyltransferase [bacterium]